MLIKFKKYSFGVLFNSSIILQSKKVHTQAHRERQTNAVGYTFKQQGLLQHYFPQTQKAKQTTNNKLYCVNHHHHHHAVSRKQRKQNKRTGR